MNQLSTKSLGVLRKAAAIRPAAASQVRASHDEAQPRKWARWQDVPDDWVLPSKRMPENPYYQTEKYKKFKKKQIFFQQNDGIPVYLKHGYPHNYIIWLIGVLMIISGYGAFKQMIFDGHVFPKKKTD